MPVQPLDFAEYFRVGLRTDDRAPVNALGLTELVGAKPTPFGLAAYIPVQDPFASGEFAANSITVSHPFPQLFRGTKHTLLVTETEVFEVTMTAGAWTLAPIILHGIASTGAEAASNNDFASGSFPSTVTDWVLGGTSFTYFATPNEYIVAGKATGTLTQASGSQAVPISTDKLYRVGFETLNLSDILSWTAADDNSGYGQLQLGTTKGTQVRGDGVWEEDILCAGGTDIVFTNSGAGFVLDSVTIKEVAATTIASGGGVWQFTDLGDSWFLHNGTTTVFRFGRTGTHYATTAIPIGAGTEYKGRAVWADLGTTNFWSSDWDTLLGTDWLVNTPGGKAYDSSLNESTVQWNSLSGGDLFFPFFPHIAKRGYSGEGYTADKPYAWDVWRRNEHGFQDTPFQGKAKAVKRLGNGVMVYGERGVAYMNALTEPATTFGIQEVLPIGIADRGAVGGTEREQVFLDDDGNLWRATATEGLPTVQRLGFSEFLNAMMGKDITIAYDAQEQEYFICDGVECYTLTLTGLGETPELVTSVTFTEGGLVGVVEAGAETQFRARTDAFDAGTRRVKTLRHVFVSSPNRNTITVALQHRMDPNAAWATTAYGSLLEDGSIEFGVSAVEFRVLLLDAAYAGREVDTIRADVSIQEKYGVKALV